MWVKALTNVQHGRNETIRAGGVADLKDEALVADLLRAGAVKIMGRPEPPKEPADAAPQEETIASIAEAMAEAGLDRESCLALAEKAYRIARGVAAKEPEKREEPAEQAEPAEPEKREEPAAKPANKPTGKQPAKTK
jgi:hypothetical protein